MFRFHARRLGLYHIDETRHENTVSSMKISIHSSPIHDQTCWLAMACDLSL